MKYMLHGNTTIILLTVRLIKKRYSKNEWIFS